MKIILHIICFAVPISGEIDPDDPHTFIVEGPKDAQITVEGESGTYYNVYLNNVERASQKTNLGGKLSFSVELANAGAVNVRIEKA